MPEPAFQRVTDLPPLPNRPADAHKGDFGRVLVLAGSRGMSGAACLTGLGALRGGAGLVYLGVPEGIVSIVAATEPSYLTVPLPEDSDGRISRDAQRQLVTALPDKNVIAVGPGLGQSADLLELVGWLLSTVERPMVVDADGLNLIARRPEILDRQAGPRVLTPHPGEFARLISRRVAEVENNREQLAAEFARKYQLVLLLKGHRTVITDGQRLAVNTTGNSGMATGGCGDVLTGLIAALLGQGLAPFEAAQLAAHLHGLAGDLAAEELSKPGLIASDLPRYLARAWTRI